MKHRIVHTLQKYVLNPPIKIALSKREGGKRGSHDAHQSEMDASETSSGLWQSTA
jgi:hypothetical protein